MLPDPHRPFALALIVVQVLVWHGVRAQSVLTDLDHDQHHIYDRMLILAGDRVEKIHSSIRPFWRSDVVALADSVVLTHSDPVLLHQAQSIWDQNNDFTFDQPEGKDPLSGIVYTRYRHSRKSFWNTFYQTPSHFYQVDVPDFHLRINPLIRFGLGREPEEGVTTFLNQRGLEIRGQIGKNVFFYTDVFDSQVRFPNYINAYTDQFGVVPGAGLYKDFNSRFFDFTNGRDFLLARAYVGVNLGKYVGFQLGHDQIFLGDGIRSLLFSDFPTPFFSLRINTRIWKLHYQNIFAELAADNFTAALQSLKPIPKKFLAAHYLSFKPNAYITLGLFEAVVFNREGHAFELQYLNPIILYRTVEGSLGSPDNVLLGFNARADLWRTASAYGQFMLDDILIANILKGDLDWWGNKFGIQLGIKYLNALEIDQLDVQVEWNQVRPFTYSHYNENANYSHYKQPIAHPAGANFNEGIFCIRYAISSRWSVKSTWVWLHTGEDADSVSMGGNVIIPNTRRAGDYGHFIGQGVDTDLFIWSSAVHFELFPEVTLDAQLFLRNKKSNLPERNLKTKWFQLGVRYNMPLREDLF